MKRLVSIVLIAGAVVLACLGAVAVVPHTHGNDWNHAQHNACPVYQFSLHALDLTLVAIKILAIFLVWSCFSFISSKNFCFYSSLQITSRAPPALF